MFYNHIAVGYAISKIVPNPIVGIPLSLISHYILDLVTYPSKEMGTALQSDLKSQRDKVTFAFVESFALFLSVLMLAIIAIKGSLTPKALVYIFFAVLPDISGGLLPILRGKRKDSAYGHVFELTKNPYLKILIHQFITLFCFLFIIFV